MIDHGKDGRGDIMGHEEDDTSVVGQLSYESYDVLRGLWVETAGWLIQEEDLGGEGQVHLCSDEWGWWHCV